MQKALTCLQCVKFGGRRICSSELSLRLLVPVKGTLSKKFLLAEAFSFITAACQQFRDSLSCSNVTEQQSTKPDPSRLVKSLIKNVSFFNIHPSFSPAYPGSGGGGSS